MTTTKTAKSTEFRPAAESDRFIVLEPDARTASYGGRCKTPASLVDAPNRIEFCTDYLLMQSDRMTREKALAKVARINAALYREKQDRNLEVPKSWALVIELGCQEPTTTTLKVNGDGTGEFDGPSMLPVRVLQPTVAERKLHPLPVRHSNSNGKAAGRRVNRLALAAK